MLKKAVSSQCNGFTDRLSRNNVLQLKCIVLESRILHRINLIWEYFNGIKWHLVGQTYQHVEVEICVRVWFVDVAGYSEQPKISSICAYIA